jgi:glucose-1-phosphate cytidylyltransferase
MFLANYGDTLTDAPLDRLIDDFRSRDAVAGLLSVRPSYSYSFHVVELDGQGRVRGLPDVEHADIRINGGNYLLRAGIFDRLESGEDLVGAPFAELAAEGKLVAFPYDGFWVSLDTLKDLERLRRLEEADAAPWEVWRGRKTESRPG